MVSLQAGLGRQDHTLATSVAPDSSEGTNPATNATDRVYSQQEDGTTLLTLTGSSAAGYAATTSVYLPIQRGCRREAFPQPRLVCDARVASMMKLNAYQRHLRH